MIEHRAAAASDVGRVRAGNEDSFHRGDAVFAVADGMGGHVAGEIASRTALEPLADLDGKVFPDGQAALDALRDAIVDANLTVAEKARLEPEYRGMGTTLTAAMIEGRRLHVAHVGDSRAYLLRHDEFAQISTDHTLVQHLIDEGQITPEEAAVHPQRSIITRAIGVSPEIDVDAFSLDIEPGDELLLCSDGLSGVVPDAVIADVLREHDDPNQAVQRLIALANEGGGPDNITAVLLRFAPEDGFAPLPAPPQRDEAASGGRRRTVIRSGSDGDTDGWAEKLGRLGAGPAATEDEGGPSRATGRRFIAAAVVVAALLAGGAAGGRWLLSRSFYVGVDGDVVAIYRGIPGNIGPLELHWLEERTFLTVDQLPAFLADDVRDGRAAASLNDARNIVRNLQVRSNDPEPGATPTPTARPTPSTSSSPTTTPS